MKTYKNICIFCNDTFLAENKTQKCCGSWCAFWNNQKKLDEINKRKSRINRIYEAKKM